MTTLSLALAVTATTLRVTALALTAAADQVGRASRWALAPDPSPRHAIPATTT